MDERRDAETMLLAIADGDLDAFVEFYEALAPRVHGLALRVLRDAHLAEDVTQEVFVQVWRLSPGFDPARGTAFAWLMTLAHRRAVDRVRSTAAHHRREMAHASDEARWSPQDDTALAAHAAMEARAVRAALATLSPAQRSAVELAYFGGHTHTEISVLMDCPVGTAKGRIRDGLGKLRSLLVIGTPEPA